MLACRARRRGDLRGRGQGSRASFNRRKAGINVSKVAHAHRKHVCAVSAGGGGFSAVTSRKRNPRWAGGSSAVARLMRANLIGARASPAFAVQQHRQASTWEYQDGVQSLIDQTLGTTADRAESAERPRAGRRFGVSAPAG